MIYVLDNFDSFTYNLVHYITAEGEQVIVERNDEIDFSNVELRIQKMQEKVNKY